MRSFAAAKHITVNTVQSPCGCIGAVADQLHAKTPDALRLDVPVAAVLSAWICILHSTLSRSKEEDEENLTRFSQTTSLIACAINSKQHVPVVCRLAWASITMNFQQQRRMTGQQSSMACMMDKRLPQTLTHPPTTARWMCLRPSAQMLLQQPWRRKSKCCCLLLAMPKVQSLMFCFPELAWTVTHAQEMYVHASCISSQTHRFVSAWQVQCSRQACLVG